MLAQQIVARQDLYLQRARYPAPMMARELVLGRACLSHVKIVFWHVLGRADLHASVLGSKLVT